MLIRRAASEALLLLITLSASPQEVINLAEACSVPDLGSLCARLAPVDEENVESWSRWLDCECAGVKSDVSTIRERARRAERGKRLRESMYGDDSWAEE
jgi:hypothetical protein